MRRKDTNTAPWREVWSEVAVKAAKRLASDGHCRHRNLAVGRHIEWRKQRKLFEDVLLLGAVDEHEWCLAVLIKEDVRSLPRLEASLCEGAICFLPHDACIKSSFLIQGP